MSNIFDITKHFKWSSRRDVNDRELDSEVEAIIHAVSPAKRGIEGKWWAYIIFVLSMTSYFIFDSYLDYRQASLDRTMEAMSVYREEHENLPAVATTTDNFEFYTDETGQWHWRRIAKNGVVISISARGYSTRYSSVQNAKRNGYIETPP